MMREEEKTAILEQYDGEIENLKNTLDNVSKAKSNLAKVVTFEETLEGVIETEEQEAQAKINKILKDLSDSTGRTYSGYSVRIHGQSDGFTVKDPGMTLGVNTSLQESIRYYGMKQKEAVEHAVKYCRNHSWESDEAMKVWIVKKVMDA